ncbi:Fimbrial protein [Lysobacter dokdonensis DS-58]|uniref:Fimbrial protein n=1 Tax=Lysobacter dokdonensis DS-58 TaxID=1300345 RepID=A0A0A2WLQ1_9GAMM|nr:fimbrial protein [Lysobacter dokdonensis]KGQ20723.1 Fimbrial protein [Lysobacter dokdonensis DS-58]
MHPIQPQRSRFFATLPVLFVAGCLASPGAAANTGQIHFEGQITDATCEVVGGTGGTPSFTVRLPVVSNEQLGPGDMAGRTMFRMSLQNCTSVANGVRVFFEGGPNVDPASGTLRTSLTDINLALFDGDGTPIAVGSELQRTENTLYSASDTMDYQVAYANVGAFGAMPGMVTAGVVYSLHYP